jgi:hypothetical protein
LAERSLGAIPPENMADQGYEHHVTAASASSHRVCVDFRVSGSRTAHRIG